MITTNIIYNNENCNPQQIININPPITDVSKLQIFDVNNNELDKNCLQFAYSLDSLCWSCYMSYNELLKNTIELNGDFYVRFKVGTALGDLLYEDESINYSSQLSSDFNFTECAANQSSNTFNPYANMDNAINLQTNLAETVSCLFGIPIYYFKLKPNAGAADYTFKEYALMGVDSVKQLKLMITDGTMPSSKPEFADFSLEFQTDWETEITKASFATAFGINAQPMEGDFIYIPMMKRMWMVSGAYEEKNGNLMWNATTFKVMLVKYQEKGSVDLQDTEDLVNSLVKNKYEDLFGDDANATFDSGESHSTSPEQASNALYPVYKSDALRKYVTCDTVKIMSNDINLYFKGTLIADSRYTFNRQDVSSKIIYQQKYCGCNASVSFIITPEIASGFTGTIIKIGNIEVKIEQTGMESYLFLNTNKENKITLPGASTYFVIIRWSKSMNLMDMSAYLYKVTNENIPLYKLTKAHYYFDIDNPIGQFSEQYNIMCEDLEGHDVYISNFYGTITNFKLFDVYNDNISELLQMFPTHQHLMINDTARHINGMEGVQI